jgi:hypothetical protein
MRNPYVGRLAPVVVLRPKRRQMSAPPGQCPKCDERRLMARMATRRSRARRKEGG